MSEAFGFTVTSNTISKNLDATITQLRRDQTRALKKIMNRLKAEVVRRTPKDTGRLRESIETTNADRDGDEVSVSCLAGEGVPYAIDQHENLQYKHKVGQAKYMESVFLEARPTIAAEIQSELRF